MSDTSRGRVTITLGRMGQVVKRDQSAADVPFPSFPSAGMKRSVRDRIGNGSDISMLHGKEVNNNKRQRGGDMSLQNGFNGNGRISKDDLRLKLIRKSASRRAESNGGKRHVDLREKLSKAVPPAVANNNSKQRLPEARESSMLGRIPSDRGSGDLARMESMRSSYSPWTLDHIRRRSPERFTSTSRGISPQRNMEDLQRRRAYDGIRSSPYVNRDVLETSRPPSAAPSSFVSHSTMSTLPPVTSKPVTPHHGHPPPPSSVASRTPYVVNSTTF